MASSFRQDQSYKSYIAHDERPIGVPEWAKDDQGRWIIPTGEVFCRAIIMTSDGAKTICPVKKFWNNSGNLRRHATSHGHVRDAGRGGVNVTTNMELINHWSLVELAVMKAAIMEQEGAHLDDGYFVPAVHCQPKETNASRNAAASASAPTQS